MGTLGTATPNVHIKRPRRKLHLRGFVVKPVTATPITPACPDCQVVHGHMPDCCLNMEAPEMTPGASAAAADRAVGL